MCSYHVLWHAVESLLLLQHETEETEGEVEDVDATVEDAPAAPDVSVSVHDMDDIVPNAANHTVLCTLHNTPMRPMPMPQLQTS